MSLWLIALIGLFRINYPCFWRGKSSEIRVYMGGMIWRIGYGFSILHIFTYKTLRMLTVHPQFITDKEGNKISVVLPIKEFEQLLEEMEDLEDVQLYDAAKASAEESIPIDEAFRQIEAERQIKK